MHPFLIDRRRLELHLVAWGLVGGILGLLVRVVIGADWLGAMAFAVPLGLFAAPLSLSAWYLARVMPIGRTPVLRVAITAGSSALVTAALWAAIGAAWWRGLRMAGVLRRDAPAEVLAALLIGLGALAYILSLAVHYLWQAFEESAAAARRALEADVAQREAELRALRAQVDPHFLFNSLNSIAALIGPDPEKARRMCELLGEFLRDSLTLGTAARIPLRREIALAEQYLHIEHVRFGDRLRVRATVADDVVNVAVPPLILQPLVENAVRHGIAGCVEGGTVDIAARRAGRLAALEVRNPRDPDAHRGGTGFGLEIVRRRLAASFGDRAAVAVEPGASTYRVSLTIPVEEGTK